MTFSLTALVAHDLLLTVVFILLLGFIAAFAATMYFVGRTDERHNHQAEASKLKD